jgi:hypothetical protein
MACNQDLYNENKAYPRTCVDCGLGPCKKYPQPELPTTGSGVQPAAASPAWELIPIWGVYENTDTQTLWNKPLGFYSTEEKAKIGARGKGWGGDGSIEVMRAIKINGLVFPLRTALDVQLDVDLPTSEELRAKALAKLTDEERKSLGLE